MSNWYPYWQKNGQNVFFIKKNIEDIGEDLHRKAQVSSGLSYCTRPRVCQFQSVPKLRIPFGNCYLKTRHFFCRCQQYGWFIFEKSFSGFSPLNCHWKSNLKQLNFQTRFLIFDRGCQETYRLHFTALHVG